MSQQVNVQEILDAGVQYLLAHETTQAEVELFYLRNFQRVARVMNEKREALGIPRHIHLPNVIAAYHEALRRLQD